MFICQATVALTRCVKPDVVENHTQFDTNIYDFVSIGRKKPFAKENSFFSKQRKDNQGIEGVSA